MSLSLLIRAAPTLRRAFCVGVVLGLFASTPVAQAQTIAVLLSDDGAAYHEVADVLRRSLEEAGAGRFRVNVSTLPAENGVPRVPRDGDWRRTDLDLLVTVGVAAATAASLADLRRPVLQLLIPRTAYEQLQAKKTTDDGLVSALFVEQPAARVIDLARITLPGYSRIGLLLGPDSVGTAKSFEHAAKQNGLRLEVEMATYADDLPVALERLLSRSSLLVAAPDPLVYSQSTVQSILLSAYRANNPVIGFSSAYVRAGALVAVFSTPEQIERQGAEMVLKVESGKRGRLPAPENPKYFSVAVNRSVARSMGISLDDEGVILDRLKRSSGGAES